MDDAGAEISSTTVTASCRNTICCDKISLTYKTAFRILNPRKSNFLSIYYQGNYPLYSKIAEANQREYVQPIYVGKAVPKGWRTARDEKSGATTLYQRLREHSTSLRRAANLSTADFRCLFMILNGRESNMITIVEAELIRKYKPLWNTIVDGFGNHDPGSGRYNQAKSEWDVLHPGRIWAERLTGESPVLETVKAKIASFLG